MTINSWLEHSLRRIYPQSDIGRCQKAVFSAARGERVSFQVGIRNEGDLPLPVCVNTMGLIPVQIRRIGYVPVPHHNTETPKEEIEGYAHIPGYVPDVLYPESEGVLAPHENLGFWMTVRIPVEIQPGRLSIDIKIQSGEYESHLTVELNISELVLQPRRDFPVTHWFYADALMDWYHVQPWSEEFWSICEKYLSDYVEHGCDMLYVPAFTPPLDGIKRPTQLLKVTPRGNDDWEFDWTQVRRWIHLAKSKGITYFEWVHLFTQWGCRNAIRIYEGYGEDAKLIFPPELEATSPQYRQFLSRYLTELKSFLEKENILELSYFHISDEPHGDEHRTNYRNTRAMIRELAPWMKVMDAISELEFAREGLIDIPVPTIRTAKQFITAGIPAWCYFCCGPRGSYLNRLLDTPLSKVRMSGWLFYRLHSKGFLHWGYNYWYQSQTTRLIDPFSVTDGMQWPNWAYGDTSVVYPGPEGAPMDSIRWEVFADSLQDYALLQSLEISPGDGALSPIHDYDDFPKQTDWVFRQREELFIKK